MTTNPTTPLVPRLRFPEFRDAGEWRTSRLGTEAEFFKGRGVSKAEIDPNGPLSCIRYAELYTRYGEVIRDVYSRTSTPASSLFLSRKDDVIVPASGETKEDIATFSCVAIEGVALGSDLNVIRSGHDGTFLSYMLNGTARREIAKVAQGDTVVHLYPRQLEQVTVALPSPAEQQKIAACLTSLDDRIMAEARALDALRRHKRGLMQGHFPRPGETVPRLRFPEFRDAGEWEETVLGNICDLKAGEFIAASEISENPASHLYPCYGGNGLRGYVRSFTHEGRYALIGRQGALCGNVNLFEGRFHATEHALVATPRTGIDTGWLYSALSGLNLNRFATGQAQPGLSVAVLNAVSVTSPRDEGEQQKIAACLTSLDDRIAAQTRTLDALRRHKRGLTQGLFPNPETE